MLPLAGTVIVIVMAVCVMDPPFSTKKVFGVPLVTGSESAASGFVKVCVAVANALKVPVENEVADGLTLVAVAAARAGEIEIGARERNATKKPRRAKRLDVNILPSSQISLWFSEPV